MYRNPSPFQIFPLISSALPLAAPVISWAFPLASPDSSLALPLASPVTSLVAPSALEVPRPTVSLTLADASPILGPDQLSLTS